MNRPKYIRFCAICGKPLMEWTPEWAWKWRYKPVHLECQIQKRFGQQPTVPFNKG